MLVEMEGVSKAYGSRKMALMALEDIYLNVEKGEFIAIMGPSGAGKSTLMHILGCLDRPTQGTYKLDGQEVSWLRDEQLAQVRNRKLGFVFQSFNLLPRMTAIENVALPLVYRGLDPRLREKLALEALDAVGLKFRSRHRPGELSGGQCQRVAIARALIHNPAILLADEPTGNLDSRTGTEIIKILIDLNVNTNVTIIIVTHDLEVANQAKRIISLKDGKVVNDVPVFPPESVGSDQKEGWHQFED